MCKKALFGTAVMLMEKTLAAAMRNLRRMQEEPRIRQKMKRALVALGPPLGGES